MGEDIRIGLDDCANEISDSMGIIETIRKGLFSATGQVEFTAWQELADMGLSRCIEKMDAVCTDLRKFSEGRANGAHQA